MSAPLPLPHQVDPALLLAFCKATADGLRLDILRVLSAESFGVMELCHIFDAAQPGMSHHLKVLSGAGLVATRREGNSIFYRRATIAHDSPLADITHALFTTIDQLTLAAPVFNRSVEIHAERARRSREFFERNAERLRQSQDQIAEFSQYASSLEDLINHEQIAIDGRVLEVGPGESALINQLAGRFQHVTAIDNSVEMLERAQRVLTAKLQDKVEFVHADIEQTIATGRRFNLMVLNMVLHHMPSPARVFNRASQLLLPGGFLLIADLCPHNQDWARDTCGDLWLGFEPTDLDKWATDARLSRGQSIYLGLKNGFQIQVRLYQKAP